MKTLINPVLFFLLLIISCTSPKMKTAFINGKIYTVNENQPYADWKQQRQKHDPKVNPSGEKEQTG